MTSHGLTGPKVSQAKVLTQLGQIKQNSEREEQNDKGHWVTCDREVNVAVVSVLPPCGHAQEPTRVELCEGADQ